jgi:Flp pilus assembly protein TadD
LASIFILNCKSVDESNTNTSANEATIVNTSATTNTNAPETAKKMPEEVPTFTSADEAAAAGDKYLDAIETENAINAYRQAVKLNPDFAEAFFKLGIAYTLREKEEYNSPDLSKEAEPTPTPKKGKGKNAVPELTVAEKAFESAAKVYEKILKKNPKDDQAQYNLGRAYNKLNKDKEAEKALRQAVKLQPENAEYQLEFGSILIKLAQYDEAVTVLNKAVKLDETNLQAQDLLEKAEAGKKRINFGIKPKPPQQQQEEIVRPRSEKAKPKAAPKPANTPATKPAPTA